MAADARPVVWVISAFSEPFDPSSPDRYAWICRRLVARGAAVTQFVSAFDHARKAPRTAAPTPWRVVQVYEPRYHRNVSLRRLASHAAFDALLPAYLLRERLRSGAPRTILAAIPHNGAACVAAVLARVFRARMLVDVHDTWPESILGVTAVRGVRRLGYALWKGLADRALRSADGVFAESVRYAERADEVRAPLGLSRAVPILLGGDLGYYRSIPAAERPPPGLEGARFLVAYAGTLGANYDLDCAVEAFARFQRESPESGLVLLGGGEREADVRARIASLGLRAWMSGRIPHPELVAHLKRAQVGLNAFRAGGNVAYSYKLNDYLLAGVPVVNSLTGESAEMIQGHSLGVNYRAGDVESLLAALRECRARWSADPDWGRHVLDFSARTLDRDATYAPLLDLVMEPAG
jgi:glycosyltransferase involved in cell wall biosynthesis